MVTPSSTKTVSARLSSYFLQTTAPFNAIIAPIQPISVSFTLLPLPTVTLIIDDLIVRKDLEVVKHTSYNSTQEMFLAQVGIQNSFSEELSGI